MIPMIFPSVFPSVFHGFSTSLVGQAQDTGAHMLIFEDFGESLSKIMSCSAEIGRR